MSEIYRTTQAPHLKVYYFLCGYWTFDKTEALEIDNGLESISLHGVAYFPVGARPELIEAEIRLLIADQRPPRESVKQNSGKPRKTTWGAAASMGRMIINHECKS